MYINNKELTKDEESFIYSILSVFKSKFTNVQIVDKKTILGIGEPNKHLMCYFSIKENQLYFKFKHKDARKYDKNIDFETELNETIKLFEMSDFTLTETNENIRSRGPYNSRASVLYNKPFEYICNIYSSALNSLSERQLLLNFDTCSKRLKNALERNNIHRVEQLKSLTINQLIGLRYFGEKCFWELTEFLELITVKNIKNPDLPCLSNEKNIELDERMDKIEFIKNSYNYIIGTDFANTFQEYRKYQNEYNDLLHNLLNCIKQLGNLKLKPREIAVLQERFKTDDKKTTLQIIANKYSVSRERIRQIINNAVKKMKIIRFHNDNIINAEYNFCKVIEEIKLLSIKGFIYYLFVELRNIDLFEFIIETYFNCNAEKIVNVIRKEIEISKKNNLINEFNGEISKLIRFKELRQISDDDFDRLNPIMNPKSKVVNFSKYHFNNYEYNYIYPHEKVVIHKLLSNNSFKQIKSHSLKILFDNNDYYPSLQVLTHENNFIVIEVMPISEMCKHYNIKKFDAIKRYCEKFKFGYLFIDDKFNSYYDICEENLEFETNILKLLSLKNKITFCEYNEIKKKYNANIKQLLTIIRKNNLKLNFLLELTK